MMHSQAVQLVRTAELVTPSTITPGIIDACLLVHRWSIAECQFLAWVASQLELEDDSEVVLVNVLVMEVRWQACGMVNWVLSDPKHRQ
jgi:hypothetical protein